MLRRLVVKEIKDLLRDRKILFGMIFMPLIIYIAMGAFFGTITKYSVGQVRETLSAGIRLAVIDLDKNVYSRMLIDYLRKVNATITLFDESINPIKLLKTDKYMGVVIVPRGFSDNISVGIPGHIEIYVRLGDISVTSFSLANVIAGIVSGFEDHLSSLIISNSTRLPPKFVTNPINVESTVVIANRAYPMASIGAFYGQLFMLPIAPMIVMVYAASIAATSIGVEKEEKTLEVLLTLPIRRRTIALAKLSGTLIIALMASLSTMIGFYFYLRGIYSGIEYDGDSGVGEVTNIVGIIGASGLVMYALSVFMTVMLTSTIGLYLGSYGEDVRGAQSMVGLIWMAVFLPLYAAMFIDFKLSPLLVTLAVSLIPFTSPLITLKSAITNNILYGALSLTSTIATWLLMVYLLSKRFEGEKLLIGKPGKKRKNR